MVLQCLDGVHTLLKKKLRNLYGTKDFGKRLYTCTISSDPFKVDTIIIFIFKMKKG